MNNVIPIIQSVRYSETFYTECFHCIPICLKIWYFFFYAPKAMTEQLNIRTHLLVISQDFVANIFLNALFLTTNHVITDLLRGHASIPQSKLGKQFLIIQR